MGYKYRNGSTPDHVTSIASSDATSVKKPVITLASAQKDSSKTASGEANSYMEHSDGYGPSLNMAFAKDSEAKALDKRSKQTEANNAYGKKVARLTDKK